MSNSTSQRAGQHRELSVYLGSVGAAGVAFAVQQLLLTWLLVGVLAMSAERVGLLQAAIGLPSVLLMLWGGASADRGDGRSLLIRVYSLALLCPLGLIAVAQVGTVTVVPIAMWGLGMSVALAFSSPAQQALLNRVAPGDVQRVVTGATAIGFLVQVVGLAVAGQLERIGLTAILIVQASGLALAAALMRGVSPADRSARAAGGSRLAEVMEGLRVTLKQGTVRDVLGLNFLSSVFNAGAFLTVFPFIVKREYGGNAQTLSLLMVAFFVGATVSNLAILRSMPLARPGRWFVTLQLSRILILGLLWIRPEWWLLVVAVVSWGLNMGVTSTLARTIVQESANPEFRGRVLGVFSLGQLGSAPLGALVLGSIIELFGTLNALVPGMLTSAILFVYSVLFTDLWRYRSPDAQPDPQVERAAN